MKNTNLATQTEQPANNTYTLTNYTPPTIIAHNTNTTAKSQYHRYEISSDVGPS